MGRAIVRCCVLLVGLVAVWVGVDLAQEPYRATAQFRLAKPCPSGNEGPEASDCVGLETGQVVRKHTYTTTSTTTSADGHTSTSSTTHYDLVVERDSGKNEKHEVDSALYAEADEGDPVRLEVWRGEVVGISVGDERDTVLPPFVGSLIWSSLLVWIGAGLMLWSALGNRAFLEEPEVIGAWAFSWLWFGLFTLAALVFVFAYRPAAWELAFVVGAWGLFGAGPPVKLIAFVY